MKSVFFESLLFALCCYSYLVFVYRVFGLKGAKSLSNLLMTREVSSQPKRKKVAGYEKIESAGAVSCSGGIKSPRSSQLGAEIIFTNL